MLSNKQFDKWSREYDKSIERYSKGYPFEGYYEVLGYVQNSVEIKDNIKILDLGIGTGLLTKELYNNGVKVYGIDFSKKMLEIAKVKMPEGIFYCRDFKYGLPEEIKDEKFDYIISFYAIHHINEDEKVELIKDLKDVLKGVGMIIIADVSFETKEELNECRKIAGEYWDKDEYYIIAS